MGCELCYLCCAVTEGASKGCQRALFVGPVDDFGYNYAANQGRLCLEAIWPGSTVYAENVPENAEAERVMEKMIQDGATIIYPTSYRHFDPATRVAKKYPNVTFLHMGAKYAPEFGHVLRERLADGLSFRRGGCEDDHLEGTWKPTVLRYGPQEGIVDLAPFGPNVPQDVKDSINKLKADVISGKVFPFTGPIKD